MKLARIEPFLMSCPMPEPIRLPFWGGERTILKRDAMLIRATADNGLQGYAPGPAHERAAREIRDVIGPTLIGKDPHEWESLRPEGPREIRHTWHAALIAIIDLAARFEECPMSELLGGRVRDRIKLYGSAGMYMTPERFAEEAVAIRDLGFSAYKMRPALGPDLDIETVRAMRAAAGPEFGLMIDAHSWWRMGDRSFSAETVRDVALALAQFDPAWLEEPLPPDDHAAYASLRREMRFPLATGEHEPDETGFEDLLRSDAADVIQMDVCCQGGFQMGSRVIKSVARDGRKFAFHSWGTSLEVMAAAQLGICWSGDVVEWLEHPCYANRGQPGMYPFPAADEILAEPLRIVNGDLVVPNEPGLGVRINESVIERYPFIAGPWSYFKTESPPQTVAVTGDHSVKWVAT